MKNIERLNAFRNEKEGKEELIAELKTRMTEMLETADQMLDRVPEEVLKNIAICVESVDLNNAYSTKNGQSYTISYCCDGDKDEVVVTANESEANKLDSFRTFLLKRYGFDWSYTQIYFTEEKLFLAGDDNIEDAESILLEHLERAFPNMEIDI